MKKSKFDINNRLSNYFELNTALSNLSNETLLTTKLDPSNETNGWGKNQTLKIAGKKVFVKRIPITDLEVKNNFSTKNHFELPTFYNYGVGSAGFGGFRELLTHIKTTNWVLSKEHLNFPLMYHYRVLPCKPQGGKASKKYIDYWNGDRNIGKYVNARKNAKFEIALFLEWFPHSFPDWFKKNQDSTPTMVGEMKKTIDFLKSKNIIHFDVHLYNILTDGKKPYLSDFGLVLDKSFELSRTEKLFFNKNTNYDYAEFIWAMGRLYMVIFSNLSKRKKKALSEKIGLRPDLSNQAIFEKLINSLDLIYKEVGIHKSLYQFLKKYKEICLYFNNFFFGMKATSKKNIQFENKSLNLMLKKFDFL